MSTSKPSIIHFVQSPPVATSVPLCHPLGHSPLTAHNTDTYIRVNISRLAGQEQLLHWALPVRAAGTSQSGKKKCKKKCKKENGMPLLALQQKRRKKTAIYLVHFSYQKALHTIKNVKEIYEIYLAAGHAEINAIFPTFLIRFPHIFPHSVVMLVFPWS